VDINNALGTAVAATSLTTGNGDIAFDQTGGGDLDVQSAVTGSGDITVTVDSGDLTATSVSAGAGLLGDGDVTLTTTTLGNVLLGGVSALADLVTVNSVGDINGTAPANLTTAKTVDLNAATGIGNTQAVNTAASNISADTTNGDVDINNALGTAVAATSLTTGNGDIAFDQTGGGDLDVQNASTTSGDITVTVDSGDLTATSVSAGTAAAGDGDVDLKTTTSGDILAGSVSALADTATLTSAGTINDTDAPDDSLANISAGTINLNTAGGDVGTSANYLDIDPSLLWNASTSGGAAYVRCVGASCALGKIDLGTGTFYHDVIGTMTDGNDAAGFGEKLTGVWSGGVWNITAGGAVLTATTGIGTSTNGIEMRLTSYGGAAGDGRLIADGGTGGVYLINEGSGGYGLTIGGILPLPAFVPAATGVNGQGGVTVIQGSPFTVSADVNDSGGGDILLAALGNTAADKLNINANVTATGGSGLIDLISGDTTSVAAGMTVSAAGSGDVTIAAGEDATDGVFNQDGNTGAGGGGISVADTAAVTSGSGVLLLDAAADADITGLSTGSNAANAVTVTARAGAVNDNGDTATDIVTGATGTAVISGATGIGSGNAVETSTGNLDATVSGSGHLQIDEVAAGGDLGINKVDQQGTGNATVRTLDGTLTVTAGQSGVSATSGNVTLEAQDAGGSGTDDLGIYDTVSTTSGDVNLTSAARDILFSAAGDVTSTLTGDITANAAQDILMPDGTVVKTGSGLIDFTAGRDIALGSVDTGSNASNAVLLTATGGEVRDGGDTDTDIVTGASGTASIKALDGIGSADALETKIGKLSAQTDTGNIRIDNTGSLELVTANGLTGVEILDSGNWNAGNGAVDYIEITTKSPFTVSAAVTNNDGGDITLASLGALAADDLTVSANIGTNGGNGNVLLTAGDTVTINSGSTVSAVGTGGITVASGEDYTDGVLDQDGNTGAGGGDIIMGATGTVQTENGDVLMDAANDFVLGIVNANSTGLGTRGDVTTFSRAGSTTDANGAALNITADTLDMTSAGSIGSAADPIEINVNTLLFISGLGAFFAATGNAYLQASSANGNIGFSATGDINLGYAHAPNGQVNLNAGGSINAVDGGTHVIADNLVTLIANAIIGGASGLVNMQMNHPGTLQVSAGGSQNGLSANLGGNFGARNIQFLNLPPGLVLLNGIAVGGANLTSLESGMSSVYESPLPYNQSQYGRIDGRYSADFPGFFNQDHFAGPTIVPIDTSALDIIGVPRFAPPVVVPLPPAAIPTVPGEPSEEEQRRGQGLGRPPLVVPIPGEAAPTQLTGEDRGTR
jgi:hypothetical protein